MLKVHLPYRMRDTFSRVLFAFLLVFLSGCSSIFDSRSQKASIMAAYSAGKFKEAAKLAAEKAESRSSTGDELMWRLEEGSAFFAVGDYNKSLEAFDKAEKIVADFENRAEISARDGGAEAGAVVTNLNALPYKGAYSEVILLYACRALCYFALGNAEGARVELRKMYERQKIIAERFRRDIEDAENSARKKNYSASGIMAKVREMSEIRKQMDKYSNRLYGDYVNPFATYLSAIGYLSDNNLSEAFVDFKNLYKMDTSMPLVRRDYVTCARRLGMEIPSALSDVKAFDGPMSSGAVYVIFANGLAAARKAMTIHLYLPPPVQGYSGVAIPVLEYFPKPYDHVEISTGDGKTCRTFCVADMDSIITTEYKKVLPGILIRTFISVAAKETANYFALREAKKRGDNAYLATMIAMSAYKYAFNTADTRCWQMLPKEYQVVHFAKPEKGIVKIKPVVSGPVAGVSLPEKKIKFSKNKKMSIIYVLAPAPGVFSVKLFEFD